MVEQHGRSVPDGSDPEPHEMELVRVDGDSGAEHWTCAACGRQMLLRWPPDYKRTVLVPGDESVGHLASKGEVEFRLTDPRLRSATPQETLH